MTATPPLTGARPARRAPRRIVAVLLSALVATGIASPAAAASTPTPTPDAVELSGVQEFSLAPLGGGIVSTGEALAVSVVLENGTEAATDATTAELGIGAAPLADRAALSRWLAGDRAGVALASAGSAALESVASGEGETTGILVAADDPALVDRGPGVYPLVVTAGELVATSAFVVPDPAASATPVGIVVPITAGPLERGLLGATRLAELTAEDGALTAQLDAVEGTQAILAVDPAIPAAIRVLGDSAPDEAEAWLARLLALPHSRFALQYGDADLAAQVSAGLTTPLAPTSLETYMSAADFTTVDAGATPSPSPTPTAAPDGPAYPDLATLLGIGTSRDGVYWPATGTAGTVVADTLAGVPSTSTPLTLVSSTSTSAGAEGATVPAHGTTGTAEVLVYDGGVSELLRAAADAVDSTERAGALAAASAALVFAQADAAGRPLLVTLDRGVDRGVTAIRATLAAVTRVPGVAPVALDALITAEAQPTALLDAPVDDARASDVGALTADEAAIARFATILDTPALLTGRERAEILQLLGLGWTATDAAAAVTAHRLSTQETVNAVGILPPSPFQLISPEAGLPFWVRNDLPWPVNVTLVAQPNDPRLRIEERTEVVALPESNTRVSVPVGARLGNGEVIVSLQLYGPPPESVTVGAVQRADVNVRADWEGIGIAVLGGLAALLLGFGIARTVLRRRRRRDTPDAGEPLTEPEVRVDEPEEPGPDAEADAPTGPEAPRG